MGTSHIFILKASEQSFGLATFYFINNIHIWIFRFTGYRIALHVFDFKHLQHFFSQRCRGSNRSTDRALNCYISSCNAKDTGIITGVFCIGI